jgi:hypothetical protein
MLDTIKMRVVQIRDMAQSNGWHFVLKEMIFRHRCAILVEKDLGEIQDRSEVLANASLRAVEIDRDLLANGELEFTLPNRRLKALHDLKLGYGGIALVRGNRIIGDTWHWASQSTNKSQDLHADLRRFGFQSWSQDCVYTFDIFVDPAERKSGISAAFQNSAMLHLRAKGFKKAYGFYWADNIPAHWCTRVTNKWKKVRDVSLSRFVFFTWADHASRRESQRIPPVLPALRKS